MRTGFKRRRDYYSFRDEKRRIIGLINELRRTIKLMEVTGILSIAKNFETASAISNFWDSLKRNYQMNFDRFVDQFFVRSNPTNAFGRGRRRHPNQRNSQDQLREQFLRFYSVRTGNLPNIHILFWLKLVDFSVILQNFLYFLRWSEHEGFDRQIEKLENNSLLDPHSTESGSIKL